MNASCEQAILGADVSKEWLDLNCFGEAQVAATRVRECPHNQPELVGALMATC
jgi:hypothetical protein